MSETIGSDMVFPVSISESPNNSYQVGLTKREYFAAQALNGLLACDPASFGGYASAEKLVTHALVCVDAMLAELSKEPQ